MTSGVLERTFAQHQRFTTCGAQLQAGNLDFPIAHTHNGEFFQDLRKNCTREYKLVIKTDPETLYAHIPCGNVRQIDVRIRFAGGVEREFRLAT